MATTKHHSGQSVLQLMQDLIIYDLKSKNILNNQYEL